MIRLITVLVLLSIPAFELVTPGMCPEDLQGLTFSLAFLQQSDSSQNSTGVAQIPESEHSNQPGYPLDDECFCCCHHITPQLVFVLPDRETRMRSEIEKPKLYISPPSDSLDHPPRLS